MASANKFKQLLADDPFTGEPGMLTKLGMSVEQFANACGLTRSAVYYYLGGKCLPSSKTLYRMAAVLNIPPETLLTILPTREEGRQKAKH